MLTTCSHFDLAIIGGGPAGCSAAITAACSGASVVLFEARDYPRHKVCGEFVSAEALDVLANLLGKSEAAQAMFEGAPAIHRTRLWLGMRKIEAQVSPAALSITRYDLDAQLWSAAQAAGVETRANCEVSSVGGDGPFRLVTFAGEFSARALIIAAGRWSQFTSGRNVLSGPKYIGVKGHFRDSAPSPTTDLYFFEGGYCGVQPVAKDIVNACAMVRSDCATSLKEVFQQHPRLASRTADWAPVTPLVTTAPLIYRQATPVEGNIVFSGDAAAFINPFVGDGISIALRSGQVAAQCLAKFLSGEITLRQAVGAYQVEYSRQFVPLLLAAARVRSLLALPHLARSATFELLRLPGVMPYVIRRTRRAARKARARQVGTE